MSVWEPGKERAVSSAGRGGRGHEKHVLSAPRRPTGPVGLLFWSTGLPLEPHGVSESGGRTVELKEATDMYEAPTASQGLGARRWVRHATCPQGAVGLREEAGGQTSEGEVMAC